MRKSVGRDETWPEPWDVPELELQKFESRRTAQESMEKFDAKWNQTSTKFVTKPKPENNGSTY